MIDDIVIGDEISRIDGELSFSEMGMPDEMLTLDDNIKIEREERKMTKVTEVQDRLDQLKRKSTAQLIIYAKSNFEVELTKEMGRPHIFTRVGYLEQGRIAGFSEKTMKRLKALEDPAKIQKLIDENTKPKGDKKTVERKPSGMDKLRDIFSDEAQKEAGKKRIEKTRAELTELIGAKDDTNTQVYVSMLKNPKRCGQGEVMEIKYDRKEKVYYRV